MGLIFRYFIGSILSLALFAVPLQAALSLESYSLTSLFNSSQSPGSTGNQKNLGTGDHYQSSLVLLRLQVKSIADTAANANANLKVSTGTDLFTNVKAEMIGKPYVYPNPMRLEKGAELGYTLSKNMDIKIQIYDIFGRKIFENNYPTGTPGGYFGYNKLSLNNITFSNAGVSSSIYFLFVLNQGTLIGKTKIAIIP